MLASIAVAARVAVAPTVAVARRPVATLLAALAVAPDPSAGACAYNR